MRKKTKTVAVLPPTSDGVLWPESEPPLTPEERLMWMERRRKRRHNGRRKRLRDVAEPVTPGWALAEEVGVTTSSFCPPLWARGTALKACDPYYGRYGAPFDRASDIVDNVKWTVECAVEGL